MKPRKIKFNWGTGILLTTVVFMSLIVAMVVHFMNQDVDLVTDNYYEKEIKYQNQIDKMERTYALSEDINIAYKAGMVKLIFPGNKSAEKIIGSIHFYRPSDFKKDFKLPVKIDESGVQKITTASLAKGYWKIKIDWECGKNKYYTERSIMIN